MCTIKSKTSRKMNIFYVRFLPYITFIFIHAFMNAYCVKYVGNMCMVSNNGEPLLVHMLVYAFRYHRNKWCLVLYQFDFLSSYNTVSNFINLKFFCEIFLRYYQKCLYKFSLPIGSLDPKARFGKF